MRSVGGGWRSPPPSPPRGSDGGPRETRLRGRGQGGGTSLREGRRHAPDLNYGILRIIRPWAIELYSVTEEGGGHTIRSFNVV